MAEIGACLRTFNLSCLPTYPKPELFAYIPNLTFLQHNTVTLMFTIHQADVSDEW